MKIKNLNDAYEYEEMAIASKEGALGIEPLPFYWEFEEACAKAGVKATYDHVFRKYILC